jgi:hypothetical protein
MPNGLFITETQKPVSSPQVAKTTSSDTTYLSQVDPKTLKALQANTPYAITNDTELARAKSDAFSNFYSDKTSLTSNQYRAIEDINVVAPNQDGAASTDDAPDFDPEPSFWEKTKDVGATVWDKTKSGGQYVINKIGDVLEYSGVDRNNAEGIISGDPLAVAQASPTLLGNVFDTVAKSGAMDIFKEASENNPAEFNPDLEENTENCLAAMPGTDENIAAAKSVVGVQAKDTVTGDTIKQYGSVGVDIFSSVIQQPRSASVGQTFDPMINVATTDRYSKSSSVLTEIGAIDTNQQRMAKATNIVATSSNNNVLQGVGTLASPGYSPSIPTARQATTFGVVKILDLREKTVPESKPK